jgi:peptide/nickel transport system substrate-binding protein
MPNSLNPILGTGDVESFLAQFVFDPLVATRVDGTLEPKLATVTPTQANGGISRDGLTITYRLRPSIRWHDGKPFTSNDVRFTYDAYKNPSNNVGDRLQYEDIARVDTPDALSFVVHLVHRSAPFIRIFMAQGVIPKHAFDGAGGLNMAAFNAAPIGTGPFKFLRWRRGERIEYAANNDYALGRPKIRKIVVSFFPDETAAGNALRTHDIDWLYMPSTVGYNRLRDHLPDVSTFHFALINNNAFYGFAMNTMRPPFDDRRVRQAIVAAIDREEIVRKVALGTQQAADVDLPSYLWSRNPAFHGQHYDLARARRLLREAGWTRHGDDDGVLEKNGKSLTLLTVFPAPNESNEAVAVQVQARLRDLGIALELKRVVANQLFAPYAENGIAARGAFDLLLVAFFNSQDPDNSATFACRSIPPHGNNLARYCNPTLDAAQAAAISSYDLDTRKRAYARVERLIVDDAAWAFLWWPRIPQIYDTDFVGYEERPGLQSLNPQRWSIGGP